MKAMTAGEFIEELERIEDEIGSDVHFIFSTKYKNEKKVNVYFGRYEKNIDEYLEWSDYNKHQNMLNDKILDNQVENLNIIPNVPNRGQVYFYSEMGPYVTDNIEWAFGFADDFQYAFDIGHVKDTDVIICCVPIPTSKPTYFETYDATITKITNNGNEVILHVEPYHGPYSGSANVQRKPDLYDIEYSVWEQNKYSVEIEAMSKEEAEAKFYEKYNGEGKPYRKDEEIIAIRKK